MTTRGIDVDKIEWIFMTVCVFQQQDVCQSIKIVSFKK